MSSPISVVIHRLKPMRARDPQETHRVSTPLELLYDLTLVVTLGVAGGQLADQLAQGHIGAGLVGFALSQFAALWAWASYTRFASAYDTDDWLVRVCVLTQMVGVLTVALGIPDLVHGLADDWRFDFRTMVLGYVIMRVPMVVLWFRAAREDPPNRVHNRRSAWWIAFIQVWWIVAAVIHLPLVGWIVFLSLLFVMEMLVPVLIQKKFMSAHAHPHHLAERYGLLVIIALGEGIVGTTVNLRTLYEQEHWSLNVWVMGVACIVLTFGLWWTYFTLPFGEILARCCHRMLTFSYVHLVLVAAIAAVGAGLHLIAAVLQHHSQVGNTAAILSIVIPLAGFICGAFALAHAVTPGRRFEGFHVLLLVLTGLVLTGAVAMAQAGTSLAWCLVIAMVAPWVTVIGFETVGHRRIAAKFEGLA